MVKLKSRKITKLKIFFILIHSFRFLWYLLQTPSSNSVPEKVKNFNKIITKI